MLHNRAWIHIRNVGMLTFITGLLAVMGGLVAYIDAVFVAGLLTACAGLFILMFCYIYVIVMWPDV